MKKIGKFFTYVLFFIFALMVFIPKSSLYYLAEVNLKKFDIIISNESLSDSVFTLNIHNLDISAKGIDSAHIASVDVTLCGVYNKIVVEKIKFSSIVEAYFPSKIEFLNIDYSLLHPLSVKLNSHGEFGVIDAAFDLVNLKLEARVKPSKLMLRKYRRSLRYFKKSKNGEYLYAKSI